MKIKATREKCLAHALKCYTSIDFTIMEGVSICRDTAHHMGKNSDVDMLTYQ